MTEKKVIIPSELQGVPPGYPEALTRDEIYDRFMSVLGNVSLPGSELALRVTEETEIDRDIVCQRVEYNVSEDEIVPAFHLFRRGLAYDAPGILAIHAHGGEDIFPVGKAYHCYPNPEDPNQYGYLAAREGFRVLAPDALCFGERRTAWGYATNFFDETNAHAHLTCLGKSLAWKAMRDNCRAVGALKELGAPVIGVIGHSGGSTQAYMLAAINEAVQAAACLASFTTLRHQFYQYRGCHCLYHFIPNMMTAGIDWDQVVSLIPPRKIFLGWGALDEGTPEPVYRAYVRALEERCSDEGLPQSVFVHEELEKGHQITMPMMHAALSFLKRWLI
jgi:pimeloyl-ACP methyl ester carboxylesterase